MAAAVVVAVLLTWYATADNDDGRPRPSADTVLGHASACACQLAAFAAVAYLLSAHRTGGRRVAYQRRPLCRHEAPMSEPASYTVFFASAVAAYDVGLTEHRRRRMIRSAAPLLQR